MVPVPDARLDSQPGLERRLGTFDAVVLGLGAMIGAGIFGVFAPAARAAGSGLLLGLAIAAGVAYCNAVASAQLAATYPTSGGTYAYGHERLGPWWGFTAGWGFVVGKLASCAAMALTFAAYAVPGHHWSQRLVGAAAVLALAALNYRGVTKTAQVTRVLVALSLAALTSVVVAIAVGGPAHPAALNPSGWLDAGGVHGVLQSAGLIFFAFAGYARLATLGEEVRDPARTIPRAIPLALGIAVVLYGAVGAGALAATGPDGLAAATAPLTSAVSAVGAGGLAPVVRVGGAIACLGALLGLIAGIGRTTLAMARQRDLPSWLGGVHERFRTPHHAEIAVAAVVAVLVLGTDLDHVIGFSSFGILVYYGIANLAAFTQPAEQRRWPQWLQIVGGIACVVLMVNLPPASVAAGVAMFAVGIGGRAAVLVSRRRSSGGGPPSRG